MVHRRIKFTLVTKWISIPWSSFQYLETCSPHRQELQLPVVSKVICIRSPSREFASVLLPSKRSTQSGSERVRDPGNFGVCIRPRPIPRHAFVFPCFLGSRRFGLCP